MNISHDRLEQIVEEIFAAAGCAPAEARADRALPGRL